MRPTVRDAGWSAMMNRTHKLHARTRALPAIAAALALFSIPAIAQEAAQQTQPVTTDTAPADGAAATDSSATTAGDASSKTTITTKRTIRHTTHAAAAKAAPLAKRKATQTAARSSTTHAAVAAAKPAAAPKPVTAVPAAGQSAVSPLVNFQPKPAPAQPQAASNNLLKLNGETLPIAGGVLALLVLGGAAAALASRRRKRREQELADQETMSYEPFETVTPPQARPQPIVHAEQPATAPAVSAFPWGSQQPTSEPIAEQDDRRPGETWVERAYRGPTPNNPSVSLRNRLKRAAFFDKREREAAAGLAAPVDARAGLPGAMVGEREPA